MPRETMTLQACRKRVAEIAANTEQTTSEAAFDLWKIARGAECDEARIASNNCRRLAYSLDNGTASMSARRDVLREIVKHTAEVERWHRIAAAYHVIRKEA